MQIGMNDYIKDKYTFKEVYELQKLPRAYDDMGNLVDLTGTGLENEYDAEVMISPDGQLSMI